MHTQILIPRHILSISILFLAACAPQYSPNSPPPLVDRVNAEMLLNQTINRKNDCLDLSELAKKNKTATLSNLSKQYVDFISSHDRTDAFQTQDETLAGLRDEAIFCRAELIGSDFEANRKSLSHVIALIPDFFEKEDKTEEIERFNDAQKQLKKDKETFLLRTQGRALCQGRTFNMIGSFYAATIKPEKECLYSLDTYGRLIVMQVTPEGALLTTRDSSGVLFLSGKSPIDRSLVDGSAVERGYFIYIGPYSYESLLGQKTVYSFKRIDDPFKGLNLSNF